MKKALPIILGLLLCSSLSNAAEILKLETLEAGGKVYKDVSVREMTAAGIKIMHSSGLATIPAAELSEDLRKRLGGFDLEDAAAAAKAAEIEDRRKRNAIDAAKLPPRTNPDTIPPHTTYPETASPHAPARTAPAPSPYTPPPTSRVSNGGRPASGRITPQDIRAKFGFPFGIRSTGDYYWRGRRSEWLSAKKRFIKEYKLTPKFRTPSEPGEIQIAVAELVQIANARRDAIAAEKARAEKVRRDATGG